jgi:hypothetical protein
MISYFLEKYFHWRLAKKTVYRNLFSTDGCLNESHRLRCAVLIEIFFFLFLKANFIFSRKIFLLAGWLRKPPVEIYFLLTVVLDNRQCKDLSLLASSAGGYEKHLCVWNRLYKASFC